MIRQWRGCVEALPTTLQHHYVVGQLEYQTAHPKLNVAFFKHRSTKETQMTINNKYDNDYTFFFYQNQHALETQTGKQIETRKEMCP